MLDKEKTKTQLIRELGVLRRQISRIEPLKAGQQQAKEALRDSEQKYRSLIANIPDVVWTTDAKGSTTFISPNVEKVYGFSPREIYEQGAQLWFGRIHPDDLEKVKKSFIAVFQGGTQLNIEYRIRRKDGEWIWIQDRSIGAYEKGGAKYADGVFFDITYRKRAEEALRKSEEFARASLNATTDMIYLVDTDGKVLTVNNNAAQNIGKTPDELIGTNIFDYFPPDIAKRRKEQGDQVVRSGKPLRFQDERKDKFFDISIYPTFNVAGKVDRLAVFVTDITERKQAENELRQTKEFTDNAINAQIDTFFVFNPKTGKAIRWNENFSRISGYTDEEISVMKAPDSYYDQDDLEKANESLKELAATGSATVELALITKKGKPIPFEYKVSLIEITGGENIAISIGRDITERKQAEVALRKSEAMLSRAQKIAHVGSWNWDFISGEVTWSDEMYRIAGIPRQQATWELSQAIVHPDDRNIVLSMYEAVSSGQGFINGGFRIVRPDGDVRHVYNEGEVILDDTGTPVRTFGVMQDITERKRAESKLQESESKFRSITENAVDFIFIKDKARQYTFVNQAMQEMLGLPEEEILEKTPEEIFGSEQGHIIKEVDDRTFSGETVNETRSLVIGDKEFFFNTIQTPLTREDGEVTLIMGIVRDITEHKQAEEQVERIFNMTNYMVCVASLDGYFTRVNPSFELILGYSSEELLSKPFFDFIHPDDVEKTIAVVEEKLASGIKVIAFENRYRCKDGSYKWLSWTSQPVPEENATYAIAYDITERKRAEKKLLDYQDQLRSLASELSLAEERQRRQIATDLHDHISQALALSLLTLQAFRQSAGSTNVHKLDEVCKTINEMIDHVRSLTFDLSPPTLYKFGLERAIAELADDQLRRHGIVCEFFDDQADKPLENDVRVLLFQSARELLINIIKHAQAHNVRVTLQSQGPDIQVCVSDDGVGFDVNKVRSAAGKRIGFGLFNIRERLDYIGGNFKIESQPGNGSRFTLTAPLKTEAVRS